MAPFDPVWDTIHSTKEWGIYPAEYLVRFVAKHYFGVSIGRADISFLDIGCGNGSSTWFLLREGFTVRAIDGSEVAVNRLKTRLLLDWKDGLLRTAPWVEHNDATALMFDDQSFDCAIDVACMCHHTVEDVGKIVNEAARVLKPGGRLFSVMPTDSCFGNYTAYAGTGQVIFLNKSDVEQVFRPAFDIEIGWSRVCQHDRMIEHWLIEGVKRE